MASPHPDVADLLEVHVPAGGLVLAVSDLHLPPERTDVSSRSCEIIASRLLQETEPLTVVLAGDVIELLGFPEATAAEILQSHDDLCAALRLVVERGGQVIYATGNHDCDLAWDVKAADAVTELTGARLCLAADLIDADGGRIRVEHGHQLDQYNCFCDPRNPLDTPLGHHIVRDVLPRVEWLGRDWLSGAHEMADPSDFPSFVGSRLFYRKLADHAWWLVGVPVALLILLRLPETVGLLSRHLSRTKLVHDTEVLSYGAVADLVIITVIVSLVIRRAWTSISALALDGRGYEQNRAARQRATDLVEDGHIGFLSGHTHHPELRATGPGFYANAGSCTAVVDAISARFGMPPAYLRTQQVSWLEMRDGRVDLMSARVELPGATALERFAVLGHHPHRAAPALVATWPDGPDWPASADGCKTRWRAAKPKTGRRVIPGTAERSLIARP